MTKNTPVELPESDLDQANGGILSMYDPEFQPVKADPSQEDVPGRPTGKPGQRGRNGRAGR